MSSNRVFKFDVWSSDASFDAASVADLFAELGVELFDRRTLAGAQTSRMRLAGHPWLWSLGVRQPGSNVGTTPYASADTLRSAQPQVNLSCSNEPLWDADLAAPVIAEMFLRLRSDARVDAAVLVEEEAMACVGWFDGDRLEVPHQRELPAHEEAVLVEGLYRRVLADRLRSAGVEFAEPWFGPRWHTDPAALDAGAPEEPAAYVGETTWPAAGVIARGPYDFVDSTRFSLRMWSDNDEFDLAAAVELLGDEIRPGVMCEPFSYTAAGEVTQFKLKAQSHLWSLAHNGVSPKPGPGRSWPTTEPTAVVVSPEGPWPRPETTCVVLGIAFSALLADGRVRAAAYVEHTLGRCLAWFVGDEVVVPWYRPESWPVTADGARLAGLFQGQLLYSLERHGIPFERSAPPAGGGC